jgi:hypothetical protein
MSIWFQILSMNIHWRINKKMPFQIFLPSKTIILIWSLNRRWWKTSDTFENANRKISLFLLSFVILSLRIFYSSNKEYFQILNTSINRMGTDLDFENCSCKTRNFEISFAPSNNANHYKHMTIIYSSVIRHRQMKNMTCISSENVICINMSWTMEYIILQRVS